MDVIWNEAYQNDAAPDAKHKKHWLTCVQTNLAKAAFIDYGSDNCSVEKSGLEMSQTSLFIRQV